MNDDSVLAVADAIARQVVTENPGRTPEKLLRRFAFWCTAVTQHRSLRSNWSRSSKRRKSGIGMMVTDGELRGWSAACQALLASSRFQVLE